jgi:polyhydroxyalkanoate synthesis regulator phasin
LKEEEAKNVVIRLLNMYKEDEDEWEEKDK